MNQPTNTKEAPKERSPPVIPGYTEAMRLDTIRQLEESLAKDPSDKYADASRACVRYLKGEIDRAEFEAAAQKVKEEVEQEQRDELSLATAVGLRDRRKDGTEGTRFGH